MKQTTVTEIIPYFAPSADTVCLRLEGNFILTSIPSVEEEDMEWGSTQSVFNDINLF